MILLIGVERNPPRAVPGFLAAIHQNAVAYQMVIRNMWLVQSDEDPETWANLLHPHVAPLDSLLVIRVRPQYNGWLPNGAWNWINQAAAVDAFDEEYNGELA